MDHPAGFDRFTVDYSATTGPANRWANVYGGPGRVHPFESGAHLGYPDMAGNDARGRSPHRLGLPFHPCRVGAAEPPPDEPDELAFDLQPVGALVEAGSRIRLTLTGADAAAHEPMAADPPPTLQVHRGGKLRSGLDLPVIMDASGRGRNG